MPPTAADADPSFWHAYLRQHAHPATRAIHCVSTALALALAASAPLAADPPRRVAVAAVCGYGPAWASHALLERNRPATWRAPLRSLVCDVRMLGCTLTGRLGRHLADAGVGGGG